MVKNKKKLRRQERLTSQTLKSLGLSVVLAGGIVMAGVGVAGAAAWTTGNLTAGDVYDTDTPNVVTNPTATMSAAGSVLFDTGLKITGASANTNGKITLGTAALEILNIKSALSLTGNGTGTSGIDLATNGAALNLISTDANPFTIAGVGTAANNTLDITNGTLAVYTNTGSFTGAVYTAGTIGALTLDGPMTVTVDNSNGIVKATDLVVSNGAIMADKNVILIDGAGAADGKYKSITVTGTASAYTAATSLTLTASGATPATLTVADGGMLTSATVTATKGTINMSGGDGLKGGTITGGITLNGALATDATLNVTGGTGVASNANTITGDLTAIKGTIVVGGANTGVLNVTGIGSLKDGTLSIADGSTLNVGGASMTIGDGTSAAATASALHVASTELTKTGLVSNTALIMAANGNLTISGNSFVGTAANSVQVAAGTVDLSAGTLTLAGGTAGAVAVSGGTLKIDGKKFAITTKTPVGAIAVSNGTLHVLNDFDNTTANGAAIALSSTGKVVVDGSYKVTGNAGAGAGFTTSTAIAGTSLKVGALDVVANSAASSETTLLINDNATKLTFTGLGSEAAFFTGSGITIGGAGASLNLNSTGFVPADGKTAGGSYAPKITLTGNSTPTEINADAGTWTLGHVDLAGGTAAQSKINVNSGILVIESLTKSATNTAIAKVLAPGTLTLNLSDVYAASASKGVLDTTSSYLGTLQLITDTVAFNDITAIKAAAGFDATDTGLLSFVDDNGNSVTITGVAPGQKISVANLAGLLIPQAVATQNLVAATTGTLANQFGAQSLELTSTGFTGTTDVTITTAAGLTTLVGGSTDVNLVTTNNGTAPVAVKSTNIAVGNNGTLTLGNPNGTAATFGTLNGNVLLSGATSDLNVTNGTFTVGNITATGTTANAVELSKNALLTANKVDFSGATGTNSLTVDGGSTLITSSIIGATGASKTEITVGSSTPSSTGSVYVQTTKLNGGSVFLDPVFVNGTTVSPSTYAAAFASENGAEANPSYSTAYLIDGQYVSGQGGQLTLGSSYPEIIQLALDTDLAGRWGLSGPSGITSAVALAKPVNFLNATSSLRVGSGLDNTGTIPGATNHALISASQFYLGENAVLGLDADMLRDVNGVTSKTAITAFNNTQTAIIEDGAKLFIMSALGGDSIKVLDGFAVDGITLTDDFANGANVFFDNYLLTAGAISNPATGGTLTINVTHNDAQTLLPGIEGGVANIVNQYNSQNAPQAYNAFMELALSRVLHNNSAAAIANSLESGIDLARASDVMGAGLATANMNFDAVLDRASGRLANNGLSAGSMLGGAKIGLWGMPLYSNESVDAKIDNTTYKVKADTNVFGGIIGVDMNYERMRFGLAFNVGTGETKSKGNAVKTKNEFDYVGGALYGAYVIDRFTLAGSVGYTSFSNSIKQNMIIGEQLKAKPDSDIWNFGAEAAYTYTLGSGLNIIPSLGVEWAYYNQSSYNTSLNGVGDVIHVGSASANQVRIPVGLKVNKTFEVSESASITPEVRARVIPMFGDSLDTTATLTNVPSASGGIKGLQKDKVAGEVGVGISMNISGNFSMAAGYDFQFSKNRTAHNVNAMLRYEF